MITPSKSSPRTHSAANGLNHALPNDFSRSRLFKTGVAEPRPAALERRLADGLTRVLATEPVDMLDMMDDMLEAMSAQVTLRPSCHALRVLGHAMAPEFGHREIIIVKPDAALRDGSSVVARPGGEWVFRQLCRRGDGWMPRALNPARAGLPDLPLPDLGAVHGVVIQKAVSGRRRLSKFYIRG